MTPHRFSVGDAVEYLHHRLDAFDAHVPRGAYTVVRQLPGPPNDRGYRVRHIQDGHERVVLESQLRGCTPGLPG